MELDSNNSGSTLTLTKTLKSIRPPPIYIKIAAKEVINFSKELESSIGKYFYLKFFRVQIQLHFEAAKTFSEAKKSSKGRNQISGIFNEKSVSVILKDRNET